MSNINSSIRSIVIGEEPTGDGLKAERIQEALAHLTITGPAAATRLKAERIQLTFRDLPGWRIQNGARSIVRSFELESAVAVGRFLQYVGELTVAGEMVPRLEVEGVHVMVGLPVQNGSWLEAQDFELAQAFEVLV